MPFNILSISIENHTHSSFSSIFTIVPLRLLYNIASYLDESLNKIGSPILYIHHPNLYGGLGFAFCKNLLILLIPYSPS